MILQQVGYISDIYDEKQFFFILKVQSKLKVPRFLCVKHCFIIHEKEKNIIFKPITDYNLLKRLTLQPKGE